MNARDSRHRRLASSERREAFGGIYPREIPRRHIEASVSESALQGVHRDALTAALDREAVTKSVRVYTSPQTGSFLERLHLTAHVGRGHRVASGFATEHGQQRTDRNLLADGQPELNFGPAPFVYEHDPALIAFSMPHDDPALVRSEIELVQVESFSDPEAGAEQQHDQRPQPQRRQLPELAWHQRVAGVQELLELLGCDRLGRELAAPVGVVRLASRRDVRGLDDAKVSLARHGGHISLSGRGPNRWRGLVPSFQVPPDSTAEAPDETSVGRA